MSEGTLTPKRIRFCQEYVIDLNGRQAAIRAGYSEKTAKSSACELLQIDVVQQEIQRLQSEKASELNISQERVLKELARIAFFDIRKLYDDDGNLKEPHDLDEDTARAIAAIEVTQVGSQRDPVEQFLKKIRTIDKTKCLELLGKHLGMFVDRVEHEGNIGQVVIMIPDNGR